jgi:hypothetical protein
MGRPDKKDTHMPDTLQYSLFNVAAGGDDGHDPYDSDYTGYYGTLPGLATAPANTGCQHEFKLYTGFRETYEYCVNCDIKRPVND